MKKQFNIGDFISTKVMVLENETPTETCSYGHVCSIPKDGVALCRLIDPYGKPYNKVLPFESLQASNFNSVYNRFTNKY